MKTYQMTMYSTRPLPIELRTTFNLPGDPYRHETHEQGQQAIEYLRSLGVIFYRDEFGQQAILIQPEDGDKTPLSERSGFMAYRHSAVLETDNATFIRISRWARPTPQYVAQKGDDRAWKVWNQPHNIVSMDWEEVRLG